MSRLSSRIARVAACQSMLLLGGCGYDYHQHSDRVGYSAGDAVKANLERETANPFRGSAFDTGGLGKNGSVQTEPAAPVNPPPANQP